MPFAARAASTASRAHRTAPSPSAWKCDCRPAASSRVTISRSWTGSMKSMPRFDVGSRSTRYGSTIEAVYVSTTPSSISLTLFARNRPGPTDRETAPNCSICSRPPSRSHQSAASTRAARPGVRRPAVDGQVVRRDDRVLPGRDAERVEVRLARPERVQPLILGVLGSSRSTRSAAPSWSVPVGAPSRSRSIRPSSGSASRRRSRPAQGTGVDPRRVPVAVRQEDRPVRHDRVEVLASRCPFGKSGMYQPLPTIHSSDRPPHTRARPRWRLPARGARASRIR